MPSVPGALPSTSTVRLLSTPAAGLAQPGYAAAVAPRNVHAVAVSTTDAYVTWVDVTPDETRFRVERRLAGDLRSAAALTAPNTAFYKDSGLTAGSSDESRVTDDKMIVRGNFASGARNLFPCQCANGANATDGNGAILDQFKSVVTQTTTSSRGGTANAGFTPIPVPPPPTHWINFASAAIKLTDDPTVDFDNNIIFGGAPRVRGAKGNVGALEGF